MDKISDQVVDRPKSPEQEIEKPESYPAPKVGDDPNELPKPVVMFCQCAAGNLLAVKLVIEHKMADIFKPIIVGDC